MALEKKRAIQSLNVDFQPETWFWNTQKKKKVFVLMEAVHLLDVNKVRNECRANDRGGRQSGDEKWMRILTEMMSCTDNGTAESVMAGKDFLLGCAKQRQTKQSRQLYITGRYELSNLTAVELKQRGTNKQSLDVPHAERMNGSRCVQGHQVRGSGCSAKDWNCQNIVATSQKRRDHQSFFCFETFYVGTLVISCFIL